MGAASPPTPTPAAVSRAGLSAGGGGVPVRSAQFPHVLQTLAEVPAGAHVVTLLTGAGGQCAGPADSTAAVSLILADVSVSAV